LTLIGAVAILGCNETRSSRAVEGQARRNRGNRRKHGANA
jgi:hypothetical protein